MDITILFKACVKTVRTTNKALGIKEQKNNILRQSSKDPNLQTAKEIIKQIVNLQNFLIENKTAYLNVVNYLSTNKTMTELDREHVDSYAEKVTSTCNQMIKDYKKEIAKLPKSKQKNEHYINIIESLENYLKQVSKIYTETKAVRVKRVIDSHKVSKLETENREKPFETNRTTVAPLPPSPTSSSPPDRLEELSPEELQMFESENEQLFNELNAVSEEVRQMESKVVHIAELQELFTEKVLQQEQDIERIATTVVGATTNMREANEQIRQAIQRNAGLRVWVLFFLLVMSFSLLFLDWYND